MGESVPQGQKRTLETVDDEHGDDGGGQHPAQIEHQLGRTVPPVKEEEGQDPGQEGDRRHHGDGGRGLYGSQHTDASSPAAVPRSSRRRRSRSSASTITPRAGSSIFSAPARKRLSRVAPAPSRAGRWRL